MINVMELTQKLTAVFNFYHLGTGENSGIARKNLVYKALTKSFIPFIFSLRCDFSREITVIARNSILYKL